MRKGELCGLRWSDLDNQGRLTVQRQLVKPGSTPLFGPVKNKAPRVLELAPETLDLLRTHKGACLGLWRWVGECRPNRGVAAPPGCRPAGGAIRAISARVGP